MVVMTVMCVECEEFRPARHVDGEVVPFQRNCPNCGHDGFESVVGE